MILIRQPTQPRQLQFPLLLIFLLWPFSVSVVVQVLRVAEMVVQELCPLDARFHQLLVVYVALRVVEGGWVG